MILEKKIASMKEELDVREAQIHHVSGEVPGRSEIH